MKALKSFFYKGDDFQPPYFWITVLMIIVIAMLIAKLFGYNKIDNALTLGVLGFVAGWVGLYNLDRRKQ